MHNRTMLVCTVKVQTSPVWVKGTGTPDRLGRRVVLGRGKLAGIGWEPCAVTGGRTRGRVRVCPKVAGIHEPGRTLARPPLPHCHGSPRACDGRVAFPRPGGPSRHNCKEMDSWFIEHLCIFYLIFWYINVNYCVANQENFFFFFFWDIIFYWQST